jgi:hypothetical protein
MVRRGPLLQINPDWIRFQLTRSHYAESARNLSGPSPKHHEWSWAEPVAASANIFYSLAYDETDKPLDRPPEREHEGATSSARPYGHHFFLILRFSNDRATGVHQRGEHESEDASESLSRRHRPATSGQWTPPAAFKTIAPMVLPASQQLLLRWGMRFGQPCTMPERGAGSAPSPARHVNVRLIFLYSRDATAPSMHKAP